MPLQYVAAIGCMFCSCGLLTSRCKGDRPGGDGRGLGRRIKPWACGDENGTLPPWCIGDGSGAP